MQGIQHRKLWKVLLKWSCKRWLAIWIKNTKVKKWLTIKKKQVPQNRKKKTHKTEKKRFCQRQKLLTVLWVIRARDVSNVICGFLAVFFSFQIHVLKWSSLAHFRMLQKVPGKSGLNGLSRMHHSCTHLLENYWLNWIVTSRHAFV